MLPAQSVAALVYGLAKNRIYDAGILTAAAARVRRAWCPALLPHMLQLAGLVCTRQLQAQITLPLFALVYVADHHDLLELFIELKGRVQL